MFEFNEYRGIRGLVIAKVTENSTGYVTEKWQELSGVAAVAVATNESSETHYYDNIGAIVVDSEGNDEYTLTVSVLDKKTKALIEGTEYSETNDVLIKTPKQKSYFALGFIGGKIDGTEEINIVYKGKFSGGDETHNTKDDGTEGTNVEYTFSAIHTSTKFVVNGKNKPVKSIKVSIGDVVTEEKIFGTFIEGVSEIAVPTPDEIVAMTAA